MYVTSNWLNDYLDPPLSPGEQAELATRAGFPLESSEAVEGDVRQDFEMTSNRGDCCCHVGLAREIAAISGRRLKAPVAAPVGTGSPAAKTISVTNRDHTGCPLYTARLIRGVNVKPSPAWLQERLIARGDIPRNNVVDATNFVLFELGQPTHVFDLDRLGGKQIIIRAAEAGEPFLPIGEGATPIKLTSDDLVIADAKRAIALAGVKGGGESAVTNDTRDILIEAATFNPVAVRNASRRHQISSDSSYRFERGVHPAMVNPAADRLTQLLLELAGGELAQGVVSAGAPPPDAVTVSMRCPRCRQLLGVDIENATMVEALDRLGLQPTLDGDRITCTIPPHRLDLVREIDLIEEVARMHGLDRIPTRETVEIRISPPQPRELAKRAVYQTLAGMGFVETVTHTLISDEAAAPFLSGDRQPLRVEDERARHTPVLRPSIIPSLLAVRAHNAHQGVHPLKLFEAEDIFWRQGEESFEQVTLTLLADGKPDAVDFRPMRGVIDRLAALLLGPHATATLSADNTLSWLEPAASVAVNGEPIGFAGVIGQSLLDQYDLEGPLLAAELALPRFYDGYPPQIEAHALPSFPAIERDVSAIVEEAVRWEQLHESIVALQSHAMEAIEFVTIFRGEPIPSGHKSVTLRCRFRARIEPFAMKRSIRRWKR